jgi:CheY-like chemotaxis protein
MAEQERSARVFQNRPVLVPTCVGGPTVLVVDDDPMVCQAFALTLEDFGCTVVATGSAREALIRVAASNVVPDLVISDYHLAGGTDGLDLIRYLRSRFGDALKSCIITGDEGDECLQACCDAGVLCLSKPVGSRTLEGLVAVLSDSAPAVGVLSKAI